MSKKNNLSNIIKNLIPLNSKVALKSMITSLVLALTFSLLSYILLKDGIQPYTDIIVGDISLPGIYKNIDFYIYYVFATVYILNFIIFIHIFNKREQSKTAIINKPLIEAKVFYIISGMLPIFLIILFKINVVSKFVLCFGLYLIIVLISLKKAKLKNENVIKLTISCYYIYLSSAGILAFIKYISPNFADTFSKLFIPILCLMLLGIGYLFFYITNNDFSINKDILVDRISSSTQLLIPLCLFSLINTTYYYKGVKYSTIYNSKFEKIIIAVVIFLIVINVFNYFKKFYKQERTNSASLITIITFISSSLWDSSYNLIINTDQFHTGETAIVYQQIVELGQKWGSEFVSVLQGVGFSLSWLNQVIFGGTYSTYNQTQNLFLIMIAIVIVLLLYLIIDHKLFILLLAPIMPLFWMNRSYLIAPVFLLLLNPKLIKNPIKWTYCFILTCIIHVWYQPTYGGAVAASLIPVLIYIWIKALKNTNTFDLKNKKERIKLGAFLFSIIFIGILCIPLLTDALHFLKSNGYETRISNGVSFMQTISAPPTTFTGYYFLDMIIQFTFKFITGIAYFIIMLYMFFRYVIKENDSIKQIQGIILTVSATIAYFLTLPATITRIDAGISRIGAITAIFFGFLLLILFYLYREKVKLKSLAMLICGVSISIGFYLTYPPYLQIHHKVNSTVYIPDDAIYAKPEETGLQKLGYAFVQNEKYLHEAMVIKELSNLILNDNQTYYDLTDKSIYYLLTNKKVPGLYVSSMVAANDVLQFESIERLKKDDVPLVFINEPLRYMGISESLRSYRIYRYFMEQDYKFVRYKNCNFLVRDDVDLSTINSNIEIFDSSNAIGIYDDFVDDSVYNKTLIEELNKEKIVMFNNIQLEEKGMLINGYDPYIVFNSNSQPILNSVQLIEINLKNKPDKQISGQLFVETDKIIQNENNSIKFNISTKKLLIKLYDYDQFNLDSNLQNLRVDFDNVDQGVDVEIESIKLFKLNQEQKYNLASQYRTIFDNTTDNRLDNIFHQPNLMNLPYQWGNSFELMKERFEIIEDIQLEKTEVIIDNSINSIYLDLGDKKNDDVGEFLRLKLKFNDHQPRDITLVVKGYDKYNNPLNEEFDFIVKDGDFLIPISSSPNCMQAKEITGFELIFKENKESFGVEIEQAQIYQLIK